MSNPKLEGSMGRFEEWNWTRAQVMHVMVELARAHHEDDGERLVGSIAATAGLNIAIIADQGRQAADEAAGILHHVGWLAAYLATKEASAEQIAALHAIIDVTDPWKE